MKQLLSILGFIILTSIVQGQQNVCLDFGTGTVTQSTLLPNGNQLHTIDVEVISDLPNVPIQYTINGVIGTITGPATGTTTGTDPVDNTIQIELAPNNNFARLNLTINTSGYVNTCLFDLDVQLPVIPVCLEILSAQEISCVVDNDGIETDGDIHIYQIQVLNNDVGPYEFNLTGTQDLLVSYHPAEYVLPGEVKTVTYEFRSNSGAPASGDISFLFENQNFTSGCEAPISLTFQPCQQAVCVEFGAISHSGCIDNQNGTYTHTYSAEVRNQSNQALQYSIINLTGGTITGGTSKTIAANASDAFTFDFDPSAGNTTTNSFYIDVETVGVTNGCEEVITVTLPDCSNNTIGSMSLLAFFDQNNNASFDVTEEGLPNVNFTVIQQSTGATFQVTTNSLGQVLLSNLEPGLYLVSQEVNIPWLVSPNGGSLNNVLINANEITSLEFANYHPNAGIAPLKIHNVDAVCVAQLSTGDNTYKVSGLLSTSFFDESTFQARDLSGGSISNLAIGQVPPLATYIPFSFDLITASANTVDVEFRLTIPLTQARDTISIPLQPCCVTGGGFGADTTKLCPILSVEYGTNFKTGQNSRLGRVSVFNIPNCATSLSFSVPVDVKVISEIKADGTLIPSNFGNNFSINRSPGIEFFISAPTNGGTIKVSTVGCVNNCELNETIESNNFSQTSFPYSIAQETPDFSNIYGATFSLKNVNDPSHSAKYISFGLFNNNTNAKIIGATGGKYLNQDERDDILFANGMKNDQAQIHFDLSELYDQSDLKFNMFYTSTRKDVQVQYNIYNAAGLLLGKGNFILDGDKVVSKIEDINYAEDDILIFPNPASDFISIAVKDILSNEALDYTIYDMNGTRVGFGHISDKHQKIDVSKLPAASYSIQIQSESGHTSQHAFLKI